MCYESILKTSPKNPLIIITLDVEKAFDKVNQDIMLQKLHNTGLPLNIWATIASLYDNPQEHVVLHGLDSRPYTVKQGVRQGGVQASPIYKLYINELLGTLPEAGGLSLSTVYIGNPTCADDLLWQRQKVLFR